jgi:hypothetical protein
LRQSEPLKGKLVGAWGGHSAQLAAAIRAHIAVADVVGENEHEVGFLLRRRRHCDEYCGSDKGEAGRGGYDLRKHAAPGLIIFRSYFRVILGRHCLLLFLPSYLVTPTPISHVKNDAQVPRGAALLFREHGP